MTRYSDIDGDSNIKEYDIGDDYIGVTFKSNDTYRYSYASAGRDKVEHMKKLARNGEGLNSFIMKHCSKLYER